MRKILIWLLGLTTAAIAAVFGWLVIAPPELLRVGDGYAAKIVCSNVFIAGRDAETVLAEDVQAPGHPLLRFVRVSVDVARKTVTARMFGFAAPGHAVYREGLGCTTLSDDRFAAFPGIQRERRRAAPADGAVFWPDGGGIVRNAAVQALIEDPALTGPGMRATVVVRGGRIIAETYGDGFSQATPLLGWSMTKSVTAALVGLRIRDGRMALDATDLVAEWRGDARSTITLSDLLAMQSGLDFNEDYGTVADVTRMLFLESDMAAFAAGKPLVATPGERFSYSSGTTTLLSRLWMNTFSSQRIALTFPRAALFRPLGMTSAVLETDAHGTFVGSSYMYATARDWARFSLFLLRGGRWNDRQLLPEDFVSFMARPTAASGERYGSGQVWTEAGRAKAAEPGDIGLPADAFRMQGHDGQTALMVPSLNLAVLRMGLTPSRSGYDVRRLHAKIIEAVK
ncbi:serine hydrolase domain-containing protein [Pararhizobium antarcticum]|uniref:6-aminohexanoate hydrolase n=1 Tax=Pararhizobium antarcticum TaxID=1798805 RepID=A0A657LTY6_9HYPH|nr:serine hydrolase [Pararhizobium antarcticum]OJF97321.1 6-aminohexanoate hydrolase [Pararhizobium antarcticum]OJG00326.1 6-aminohexanoate hydrolase [Rhizobium sp. 58]